MWHTSHLLLYVFPQRQHPLSFQFDCNSRSKSHSIWNGSLVATYLNFWGLFSKQIPYFVSVSGHSDLENQHGQWKENRTPSGHRNVMHVTFTKDTWNKTILSQKYTQFIESARSFVETSAMLNVCCIISLVICREICSFCLWRHLQC